MSEPKLTHREQRLFYKNGIVHTVKQPHHHYMSILLLNKQQKGSCFSTHTLLLSPSITLTIHIFFTYVLNDFIITLRSYQNKESVKGQEQ